LDGLQVNDKETIAEWLHYNKFLLTDESRFALWSLLKQQNTNASLEALRIIVALWLKS
jgi:hypothetical protein